MIDAHIQDGDVVFLEERDYARDGDIIAACVNGETTLKFYKPRKDGVYLLPANSQMAPIKVEGDFQIQGVLVGLLRVY
jgi:repressor LexA